MPDRVKRFLGTAGSHRDPTPCQQPVPSERLADGGQQFLRGDQAPGPDPPGRQTPGGRSHDDRAARAQRCHVALGDGVRPHVRIHGRSNHQGGCRGQCRGGEQVVSQAVRHLGDSVRGGGSDDEQVGLGGQRDVRHVHVPQQQERVEGHRALRQRLKGQRRHKVRGRLRHDHIDPGARLDEFAAEVDRLVAGDSTRHAEHDILAFQDHGCPSFRRNM